jgi:hypothetical protein
MVVPAGRGWLCPPTDTDASSRVSSAVTVPSGATARTRRDTVASRVMCKGCDSRGCSAATRPSIRMANRYR